MAQAWFGKMLCCCGFQKLGPPPSPAAAPKPFTSPVRPTMAAALKLLVTAVLLQ
jgi:hypothetical protein